MTPDDISKVKAWLDEYHQLPFQCPEDIQLLALTRRLLDGLEPFSKTYL